MMSPKIYLKNKILIILIIFILVTIAFQFRWLSQANLFRQTEVQETRDETFGVYETKIVDKTSTPGFVDKTKVQKIGDQKGNDSSEVYETQIVDKTSTPGFVDKTKVQKIGDQKGNESSEVYETQIVDQTSNQSIVDKISVQEISDQKGNESYEVYETDIEDETSSPSFVDKIYPRYDDKLLVEWEPAPKIPLDPKEPGHLGKAVVYPASKEPEAIKSFEKYRVNVVASDMIPFNRTLKDYNYPECNAKKFPKKLPPTTVIIVFSDEAWSTLIRTVWSVYSRSPRALLKEIILVDDCSTYPHLGQRLDDYIKQIPVKIRIIRLKKRAGLTVAKLEGIKLVTTPTVTFMDSHCECSDRWLEPLLTTVLENRKVAVTPMVDFINAQTMALEIYGSMNYMYGGFEWNLFFSWLAMPEREMKRNNGDRTANIWTPELAGGIFSVDKEYFYDVGAYDEKMVLYGAENIEMSVRFWMCGGRIETARCARVAHIQRDKKPYTIPGGLRQSMMVNTVRVADVWLDDYKKIFYAIHPEATGMRSNVTERVELRRRLQCKPFKWYIENIFPESVYARKYKDIGIIEILSNRGFCIDTYGYPYNEVKLNLCKLTAGEYQKFILTERGEIVVDDKCITADSANVPIRYSLCRGAWSEDAQIAHKFIYNEDTKTFKHAAGCLTYNQKTLTVTACINGSLSQRWQIHSFVLPDGIL